MKLKYIAHNKLMIALSLFAILLAGCDNNSNNDTSNNANSLTAADSSESQILKINDEIFSVPSPIQFTSLIRKSGAVYNREILNPTNKLSQYSTNFSKALNFGIYGADLGYVVMYSQSQDAINYLNSTKKMSDELGLKDVFDINALERFTKNFSNQDSLLVLISAAYRSSDAYLKDNNRMDVCSLILAGGWIESLYLTTNIYNMKANEDIKNRMAEQKLSLQNVIKSLTQYKIQPEFIDKLKDLSTVYDSIEFEYIYVKPTTDAEKKMTTINSKTVVKITPEQIQSITQKIKAIRSQIVG